MTFFVLILATILILCINGAPVNVHIIPHSHDDPGWLKTADQYYTGSNNTIYLASVQYIFDSVLTELAKNPARTYSMCEISFLARWWGEQDDATKKTVRGYIKSGRIAVLNGGWVMHDEATAHYVSMIDQTTLGHEFLRRELDYKPKVGWQIDPFGHSNTHAWLSSEFGFDSLFFGRIDYQDHDKRMATREMELVWKGSASQDQSAIFTGAFTSGNYGAPQGLCIDRSCVYCRDDPVVDDTLLETFNLPAKVAIMVEAIDFETLHSKGNNIMIKMGADFTYDNAQSWYKSTDKLIAAINAQYPDKYRLFYSTPDKYTEARAQEAITWTVKTDDFFPYADCAHCYWSGYFTSRPTLKFLERTSSGLLQTLRQTMLGTPSSSAGENTELVLTAAVGLVNHHDSITGTSKQHVADDYNKILSSAVSGAEALLAQQVRASPATPASPTFSVCRASNESSCAATQALSAGYIDVLAYNPLPRVESQTVKVFLSQRYAAVQAVGSDGSLSPVPEASIFPTYKAANSPSTAAKYTLVFAAKDVPSLKSKQYLVSVYSSPPAEGSAPAPLAQYAVPKIISNAANLQVSSNHVDVGFDSNGLLSRVTRKDPSGAHAPISADVSQNLAFYTSFGSPGVAGFKHPVADTRDPSLKNIKPAAQYAAVGAVGADASTQASGAYLFRPLLASAKPVKIAQSDVSVEVVESAAVVEVRQSFSSWASQVIRLVPGSPAVELEWTVGPIPVDDGLGKEVVSTFTSSLNSGPEGSNVCYTDANGREFQRRQLNYRPTWDLQVNEPIAGNYYPITTGIYLEDTAARAQLSVLSDRAQAAASLRSGELEVMVHRRLVADDNRGVNEPLNETTGGMSPYPTWTRSGDGITVSGKHWLVLSDLESGMQDVRALMDKVYSPLQLLVQAHATEANQATVPAAFSLGTGLGWDLPMNVHLMTLHRLPGTPSTLFFRLAHQFAVGESSAMSMPVQVDIAKLLAPFGPLAKTLTELNLSGNQLKAQMDKDKVEWKVEGWKDKKDKKIESVGADTGMIVTLTPMQIRTFTVELQQ